MIHNVVIPLTFVVDKGSETGYVYAQQTGLRCAAFGNLF